MVETPITEDTITQARLAEHQQRRRVELLRQQVYGQDDPGRSPGLLQNLAEAEQELARLEAQRQALEGEMSPGPEGSPGEVPSKSGGGPPKSGGGPPKSGGGPPKSGGVLMSKETTGLGAEVLLRQSHVPTGIVHLLDAAQTPLVTFKLEYAGGEYVRARVSSFVEGYTAHSVDTVELTYKQPSAEIPQLPTFFPASLAQVTEMTRATLHIQVDDLDAKTERENTYPIWLLARSSVTLGMDDPATGKWIDLSYYLGAYVTPHAPAVLGILRKAAELSPGKNIAGYQAGVDGVEAQVKSIYQALQAEDIHYVNSSLTFGAAPGQLMQRIRLPREALETRSANCLDGALLMASLLEAATLNPGIVLAPGHAFLAWETEVCSGNWDYLETTLLGTQDFDAAHASGQAQAKTWKEQARKTGDERYFHLLSIEDLRVKKGITPVE